MKKFYALGRLKPGERNKTEAAYEQHLELLKRAGEVLWYQFEGIKLRLADNTFLTVDFSVMNKDCVLEMHDCKPGTIKKMADGREVLKIFAMDDAKAKMKVAAEIYPFVFKYAIQKPKKMGGGWQIEEV